MVALETRSGRKGRLRGEGKLGGLIDIFTIFIVAIVSWCMQECSIVSDSLRPLDCGPPGTSVHAVLHARILEWVLISSPGDLPDPGIKPTSLASPALAGWFFYH